jgi:hypothetical protein
MHGSEPELVSKSFAYTLPAAPPPVESEEAVRLAALHSAGPAAGDEGEDADDGGWLAVGVADGVGVLDWLLAEGVEPVGVPWDCG